MDGSKGEEEGLGGEILCLSAMAESVKEMCGILHRPRPSIHHHREEEKKKNEEKIKAGAKGRSHGIAWPHTQAQTKMT